MCACACARTDAALRRFARRRSPGRLFSIQWCVCLLLQDLLQSCSRGESGRHVIRMVIRMVIRITMVIRMVIRMVIYGYMVCVFWKDPN